MTLQNLLRSKNCSSKLTTHQLAQWAVWVCMPRQIWLLETKMTSTTQP